MATIENRSRYCVTVKNRDDLKQEFPFSKPERAKTYLEALREQGFRPKLEQAEDQFLVRIRQKGFKPEQVMRNSREEANAFVMKIEEERSRGLFIDYNAAHKTSFGELLVRYLEEEVPKLKSSRYLTAIKIEGWLEDSGPDGVELLGAYRAKQLAIEAPVRPAKFKMREVSTCLAWIHKRFSEVKTTDVEDYNHEFYGHQIEDLRARLQEASAGTCITLLDNSTKVCGSVRILGATLWTDYRLELNRTQRQLLEQADLRINDHRRIQAKDGQFSARHALAEHEVSRAWLARELEQPHPGKTVVVTHHGPHRMSIHPRYAGDALNAAFVSNLSELLPRADLWIHGHVHDTFDYNVGRCRVVANPIGYPRNRDSVDDVRGLVFENTGFQSACVVEV